MKTLGTHIMKLVGATAATSALLVGCGAVQADKAMTIAPDAGSGSGSGSVDHAPAISIVNSIVRDERGDTIDFSAGDPVHHHDGAAIDLAGAGCPVVYKFGYLLDPTDPPFGSEATKNPLAWNFAIDAPAGFDPSQATYRVRDPKDRVAVDWAPLALTDATTGHVGVFRSGPSSVQGIDVMNGNYHLDVRVRDAMGRETTMTACWEHHVLAAPLEIGAVVPAQTQMSLLPMQLGGAPVSDVLDTAGVDVFEAPVVQHTAEVVVVSFGAIAASGTYSKIIADRYVTTATVASFNCGTTTAPLYDPHCRQNAYASAPDATSSGPLASGTWTALLVDSNGLAAQCDPTTGCVVPARAAGGPPLAYRVIVSLANVTDLQPAATGPFGDFTLLSRMYTGLAPDTSLASCSGAIHQHTNPAGITFLFCPTSYEYAHITALEQAQVSFDSIALPLSSAVYAGEAVPVTTVASGTLLAPPLVWNAGTAVLPGS